MKAKLTPNQKEILDALKNEFLQINEAKTEVSGLIDISDLILQSKRKQEFKNEINLANNNFIRLMRNQMIEDAKLLKNDLDKLGLHVVHSDNDNSTIFSITSNKIAKVDMNTSYLSVSYTPTHHVVKTRWGVSEKVHSKFGIGSAFYGSTKCLTLAEYVKTDAFKHSLFTIYEKYSENN